MSTEVRREPVLTAEDVAAELRVSIATAYRLMGEMTHLKLHRSIRVTRKALDAYLRQREVHPSELPPIAPRRGSTRPVKGEEGGRPRNREQNGVETRSATLRPLPEIRTTPPRVKKR